MVLGTTALKQPPATGGLDIRILYFAFHDSGQSRRWPLRIIAMATSTDLPPGNVVTKLVKFGHSPDFSEGDFTFQMGAGNSTLTLRMSKDVLRNTASGLTEASLFLQTRARTTPGHTAVLLLEMTEASAVAAAIGGKVVIRLKGVNGIDYNFSVAHSVAAQLQSELSQAVKAAQETNQTRQ